MKAIEGMEKASTTEDMETVNLVKRLLGTRELTPVVGMMVWVHSLRTVLND